MFNKDFVRLTCRSFVREVFHKKFSLSHAQADTVFRDALNFLLHLSSPQNLLMMILLFASSLLQN